MFQFLAEKSKTAVETVQCPPVLLHYQLGEETDPRPSGREADSYPDWHGHRIANTSVSLHDERLAMAFGDDARDGGYHPAPVI